MGKDVLVIIDPQNDFTADDGYYAGRHGINAIGEAKRNILSLLDKWQKKDVLVVCSDYTHGQFKEGVGFAIPGTPGHEPDNDFGFGNQFLLFAKMEHSAFSSKKFVQHLADSDAHTLYICGFLAEYCVKQTSLDALANGFEVCLVEDCIGTGDDVLVRKMEMISLLKTQGARIVSGETFLTPGPVNLH